MLQQNVDNPRLFRVVRIRIPDPSPYRKAVCKAMTKLGDILSASRRKSWPGDQIWCKHIRGLYVYCKIKDILLYGKTVKGVTRWHTGERFLI